MKKMAASAQGSGGSALLNKVWGDNRTFLLRAIIYILISVAFAPAKIAGKLSPFGFAFVCATPGKFSVFSALGSVVCYLLLGGDADPVRYVAQIVVALAIKWAFAAFLETEKKWALPLISGIINLSVGSVTLFLNESSVLDVVLLLSECVLCAGVTYFMCQSIELISKGEGLSSAQGVIAVSTCAALIILSLSNITVGVISLGTLLAAYLTLSLCYSVGAFGGACAGICIGAALSLSSTNGGFFILALGLGGMISGLFSKMSRYAVVLCYLLCCVLAVAVSGAEMRELYFLYDSLSASVLFLLTPDTLFARIVCFFPSQAGTGEAYPNKYLAAKLNFVSQSLCETSQAICKMSENKGNVSADMSRVFSGAADSICRRCSNKLACWDTNYTDTMDSFNHLIKPLKENGRIEPQNVPDYLRRHCLKLSGLVSNINSEFYKKQIESQNALRQQQIKEVMTNQFSSVARLLCEMSQELSLTMCDRDCEAKLNREFLKKGITVSDISCPVDKFGHMAVEFYLSPDELERITEAGLCEIVEDICESQMQSAGSVSAGDVCRVGFCEQTPFRVISAGYQKNAEGENVCGDGFLTTALGGGFFANILSDGMGKGESAALDSRLTLSLASKFLKLGFSMENTASLVNSALQSRSDEESLSTLDVAIFDLYSGSVEIKKMGAAPSFLKHGKKVTRVQTSSLPLGILNQNSTRNISIPLSRGDIVVMASDGLCSLTDKRIEGILKKSDGLSPEQIAQKLVESAVDACEDIRRDDITVLVTQIV